MPKIQLPNIKTNKWVRPSEGEIFGGLWSTKNISLNANEGRIRLSPRMYRLFDSDDDSDFKVPVAFIKTDADAASTQYFALTQNLGTAVSRLFRNGGTDVTSGWTEVTGGDGYTNIPTDAIGDMVIFGQANGEDRLVIARDDDLILLNNGKAFNLTWWTSTLSQSALAAATERDLHVFTNLLLVPDGNLLHTIDDSLVVTASKLTLPKDYEIVWIEDDSDRVYLGTRNTRGGEALIFPWRVGNDTYDEPLKGFDRETLAGVSKNGVLHVINSKGYLLGFNGSDMEILAKLPIADSELEWKDAFNTNVMVHHNGMKVIEGDIHIALNAALEGTDNYVLHNMPSGIWVFDDHGLHNKYTFGQRIATNDSWGASVINATGALFSLGESEGRFLAGATIYSDNLSTKVQGMFSTKRDRNDTSRGYFITSQLSASSANAFWKRLQIVFDKMENSTDRIIVKYRTAIDPNFEDPNTNRISAAWTGADTFTSSANILGNASVGDEIEILNGDGDGAMAHIKTITPTYTVVLDESIPNLANNEDSHVRVMNWIKLTEISSQTIQEQIFTISKNKRAPWIQFKVELRGTVLSPEIQKLLVEFNPSKR